MSFRNVNVICFLLYKTYQKLEALNLMNFKGRESTTPQKFCSTFFVENIIIFVKKCNCVWKKHKILATGLRAATWRRRTWRGRRKSTGSRRTGTRRGQGEQEKQDREEKSTVKRSTGTRRGL